jgi:hypothetical protein
MPINIRKRRRKKMPINNFFFFLRAAYKQISLPPFLLNLFLCNTWKGKLTTHGQKKKKKKTGELQG